MSDNIILTEKDISILTDKLVEIKGKWKILAKILRLPDYVTKLCEKGSNDLMRLYGILNAWISQRYSLSLQPPTLGKLKEALDALNVEIHGEGRNLLEGLELLPNLAAEIAEFIVRKEKLKRSTAHVMMIGFPGNGKSHLLDNLLNNSPKQNYSSTGISDSVVVVDVESNDETFHTAALNIDSTWKQCHSSESFMMQVEKHKQIKAKNPESAILPSIVFEEEMHSKNLAQCIEPVLLKNKVETLAQLNGTSSLYFRDTGGQVEFQEILTILIDGPSIFFFVLKAHIPLDQPLTLEYRKGSDIINTYESCTTTRQALIETLATIDARAKLADLTMHNSLVFIIATHTDKLGDDSSEKEEKLRHLDLELESTIKTHHFEHLIEYKDRHYKRIAFPVSNISYVDKDFQTIRSRLSSKLHNTRFFETTYPASYLLFCLELRNYTENILTFKKCIEIAEKFKIRGEKEVTKMLLFLHHRIGIIKYYDIEGLRDLVIKEPQILFNKLTELIVKTFPDNPIHMPSYLKDLSRGIVEKSTLENLFLESDCDMKLHEFLLLLGHLRIIVSFIDEDKGKQRYFIPAVINHLKKSTNINESNLSSLMIGFSCHYCPKSLLSTIVCHFTSPELTRSMEYNLNFFLIKKKIFKDEVHWKVYTSTEHEFQGTISLRGHTTCIEVSFYPDGDMDVKTSAMICNSIREILGKVIDQSLRHLRYDRQKIKYIFKCECGDLHTIIVKKKISVECKGKKIDMSKSMCHWFNIEPHQDNETSILGKHQLSEQCPDFSIQRAEDCYPQRKCPCTEPHPNNKTSSILGKHVVHQEIHHCLKRLCLDSDAAQMSSANEVGHDADNDKEKLLKTSEAKEKYLNLQKKLKTGLKKLDKKIECDQHLRLVAEKMDHCWDRNSDLLQLKHNPDVQDIQKKFLNDPFQQRKCALFKWRKVAVHPTYDYLLHICVSAQWMDSANVIIEILEKDETGGVTDILDTIELKTKYYTYLMEISDYMKENLNEVISNDTHLNHIAEYLTEWKDKPDLLKLKDIPDVHDIISSTNDPYKQRKKALERWCNRAKNPTFENLLCICIAGHWKDAADEIVKIVKSFGDVTPTQSPCIDSHSNTTDNDSILWKTIGNTSLYMYDKKILESRDWLTDTLIWAAQQLIKKKFPHISGLQNPILQCIPHELEIHKDNEFIQCLNVNGNHWITVSNIACSSNTVRVYDSLNLTRLPSATTKIIAELLGTPNFTIEYAHMQYQDGGNDCGLFAIASACAISYGQDPSMILFDQARMRNHLLKALETKNLTPFPSTL